jgi:branched-chain amino acid transport system substrate-binding protein
MEICNIKSAGVALLLAAFALLLTGCEEEPPIRIGFIGGLTGRSADIGQASRNAVQMAIEEINEKGGVNGRKLELLIRDDKNSPETAGKRVRELATEGVTAIIGPNLSSIAGGMLPAVNETQIITISPTVSSLFFVGKDDPFFRMNSNTRQNARAYAAHHIEKGGKRVSAAFGLQNRLFTESWLEEFRKAFEALGGRVVAAAPYDAKSPKGYASVVESLLSAAPDAILLVSNGVDTALLAQQIRKTGSDVHLIAAEWAAPEQLIELGGKAVEGITILQTYDRDSAEPHFAAFRNAYFEHFAANPGYASIAAYDAVTVLIAALEQQDGGRSLKEILVNLPPLKGLQQDLAFDEFGDGVRKKFFVTVKNGDFVGE